MPLFAVTEMVYEPGGVPLVEGGAGEFPPPQAHNAMARMGAKRQRSLGSCVAEAVRRNNARQKRTAIAPIPNHRVGSLGYSHK